MQKFLISELLKRPIAYNPIIAKALDSAKLAILWSQLYYWSDKTHDPDGWIYKTQAELYNETGLSRKEQETARKIGREHGVLEEKLAGHPAKLYYRINMERSIEAIERFAEKETQGVLPIFKEKIKPISAISYLREIPAEDIKELSNKYRVGEKFIKARAEDVIDYCEAKGKTYRDYKAALRNFIKTHLERHPEAKTWEVPKQEITPTETLRPRTPEEQERLNNTLAEMRKKIIKKL